MSAAGMARLLRARWYGHRHPDEPWMAPSAIRWLDAHLDGGSALEWGAGRSTSWFAARVDRLLSVEHDVRWFDSVRRDVPANVDLRLIALDHDLDEPTRRDYEVLPAYVAVVDELADGSLHLAVVDGHYREACVREVVRKLRPQGLLVIDNSDWLPEWGVPSDWPVEHRGRHGYGETSVWRRP